MLATSRLFVVGALIAAATPRDAATDDEIWGKLSALTDARRGALEAPCGAGRRAAAAAG